MDASSPVQTRLMLFGLKVIFKTIGLRDSWLVGWSVKGGSVALKFGGSKERYSLPNV